MSSHGWRPTASGEALRRRAALPELIWERHSLFCDAGARLATRHGITNVAVLERKYIGGGNSGRNTTVIRSNYGIPEAVRFYQRSVELYQQLEAETERWMMHKEKGLLWIAHSEAGT